MTQEEKDLLLKDLSGRLPYGVKVWFPDWLSGYTSAIESIDIDGYIKDFEGTTWEISDCKPYLFPLESMTEEQLYELREMFGFEIEFGDGFMGLSTHNGCLGYLEMNALFDWFHKNHFDYRGLIPMGSANDATGKNIY